MPPPRLLDQVRDRLRVKHYSMRTEDTYLQWIRRFIFFHGKKHPREMGGPQVEAFLSHLATVGRVAAATQNSPCPRYCFFTARCCKSICRGWMAWCAPSGPSTFRSYLRRTRYARSLVQLEGTRWLVIILLYSSGMRLLEELRLRVKDIDFERHEMCL